jgi:hypothetical protein
MPGLIAGLLRATGSLGTPRHLSTSARQGPPSNRIERACCRLTSDGQVWNVAPGQTPTAAPDRWSSRSSRPGHCWLRAVAHATWLKCRQRHVIFVVAFGPELGKRVDLSVGDMAAGPPSPGLRALITSLWCAPARAAPVAARWSTTSPAMRAGGHAQEPDDGTPQAQRRRLRVAGPLDNQRARLAVLLHTDAAARKLAWPT